MGAKKTAVPVRKSGKALALRKNGLPRNAWGETQAKLHAIGLAAICTRIANGEYLMDIAESIGIDASGLSRFLNASELAQQTSARVPRIVRGAVKPWH